MALRPPRQLSGAAWQRCRIAWLATGAFVDDGRSDAHSAALAAARAARAELRAAAKPVRIREASVLAALRDPSRLVEFSRPMPLAECRRLVCMLWEEETANAAPHGGVRPAAAHAAHPPLVPLRRGG